MFQLYGKLAVLYCTTPLMLDRNEYVTSGQSNLTKGRIAPLVTTNSLVPHGR